MEQVKRCSKCHTEKPRSAFYRSTISEDKLKPYCRECQLKYYKSGKGSDAYETIWGNLRPDKEDYFYTYKFLRSLGYDVTGDIHQQFCDRYGLPTKKKRGRQKPKYSGSDFDFS